MLCEARTVDWPGPLSPTKIIWAGLSRVWGSEFIVSYGLCSRIWKRFEIPLSTNHNYGVGLVWWWRGYITHSRNTLKYCDEFMKKDYKLNRMIYSFLFTHNSSVTQKYSQIVVRVFAGLTLLSDSSSEQRHSFVLNSLQNTSCLVIWLWPLEHYHFNFTVRPINVWRKENWLRKSELKVIRCAVLCV